MMRYRAIASADHECCNGASVIDTTQPKPYTGEKEFKQVCECLNMATAELIANALNNTTN